MSPSFKLFLKGLFILWLVLFISAYATEFIINFFNLNKENEFLIFSLLGIILFITLFKYGSLKFVFFKIDYYKIQSLFNRLKKFFIISWKYMLALVVIAVMFQIFFRYETVSFGGRPAKIDRITGNVWIWSGNWKCLKCDE